MKLVLDTNVLVSGLLKAHSSAASIVKLVLSGSLAIVYDSRIMSEYRDVLYRPRFNFDRSEAILAQLETEGIPVVAKPLPEELPDRDDEPFWEAALAVSDAVLVTGNKKHFPLPPGCRPLVLSPSEFITFWREKHGDR